MATSVQPFAKAVSALASASVSEAPSSAELFQTVFEMAQVPIFCINQQGKLAQVNPACCELLGWTQAELCGKSFTLIAPENIEAIADRFLAALLSESKKLPAEWRVRHRDGSLFEAHAHIK